MYAHYDRAANAVGLYGPPGFKSPILRHLSSSYARTLSLGGLLLSAFSCLCVATAWPSPQIRLSVYPGYPRRRAGLSHARIFPMTTTSPPR
jgi:hypothetical protein